jgi:hypothetical protein
MPDRFLDLVFGNGQHAAVFIKKLTNPLSNLPGSGVFLLAPNWWARFALPTLPIAARFGG